MKKILIVHSNPWSFCLAVERSLADEHPASRVDALNLYRLCESFALNRPVDRAAEVLNRKFERFVVPRISGKDITSSVAKALQNIGIPPLPASPAELRSYCLFDAPIGLAVLSSVTSETTVMHPADLSEYGSILSKAWRSAHLSVGLGHIIATMNYDAAYVFNGRHCTVRPFCDVMQKTTKMFCYEQGGTGKKYVMSDKGIHNYSAIAELIMNHDFDYEEGEAFYTERLRKAPGNEVGFFTASQVDGLLPDGVSPGRIVSYFTSSSDETYAASGTPGFGEFGTQHQIALCIARVCSQRGERLVIRFHPHLQYKHLSWRREWDFEELRANGVLMVEPSDPTDSYALLRASRCVITCGSTIGFEASYLGVPAAEAGHWAGGGIGALAVLQSQAEVEAFVRSPAVPTDAREKAILYGSYARRAGKLLPHLEPGIHPYYARISGRIVDPVRFIYQRIRALVSLDSRKTTLQDGKLVVEPSVVRLLTEGSR